VMLLVPEERGAWPRGDAPCAGGARSLTWGAGHREGAAGGGRGKPRAVPCRQRGWRWERSPKPESRCVGVSPSACKCSRRAV